MPIHLKQDLIDELALMHKYGIITVLPFSKYANPVFAQTKPNGKLRLCQSQKNQHPDSRRLYERQYPSQHFDRCRTTPGRAVYSANLTAPKLITACRWRTNVRWKCLHSISRAQPLPTKDLRKVSADL